MPHITPIDPSTGEKLDPVTAATAEEVRLTVAAARQAFPGWRSLDFGERADHVRRAAGILESRAEPISKLIMSEMGRVRGEAVPEVTKSAAFLRYFADRAARLLADEPLDLEGLTLPEKTAFIKYEPRGVVGLIKPWNAPVQQTVWALGPALMAGCVAVIKPSEYTPRSSMALQEAFDDAGIPPGVVSTVLGADDTGRALVEADVDVIAFTGSISSGRDVAASAGRRLKKTILELSGKDSLIVDASFGDLDLLVAGIVYGAFSNCGHWCSSVERVFLPESRYDEILEAVIEKTEELRVGPPDSADVDMGPIANKRQFDIVTEILADATDAGATIVAGGYAIDGPGYFHRPTILTGVTETMRLYDENVFGPVVAVDSYSSLDEVITAANDTNYGLGLSVWTEDEGFASRVIAGSDTGMVWVNEPLQSIAVTPWSVCKDSGIGVELGAAGMREFTYPKVVNAQYTGNDGPRPWYFPYGS